MTVGELLHRISSRELAEWMAYYRIEADDERQRYLAHKAEQGIQRTKTWRR